MGDESEEEVLLYLEFNGMLHEDIFNEPNLVFKTIGFETDNPILQIGEEVYQGEYDYAKGTNVFFEEDPTPVQGDPIFEINVDKRVKYLCKTNKILKMNRIFLKEKQRTHIKSKSEEIKGKPEQNTIEFSETYEEALDKLSDVVIHQLENDKEITGVEEDEKMSD